MSIDKQSSGLPEVHLERPDTKINVAIVVGVLLFLVLMAVAVYVILW